MTNIFSFFRLMAAAWVMAREGVVAALPGDALTGLPHFGWRIGAALARRRTRDDSRSERLSRALNRLGPSYIKLGQFLGSRPDLVGNAISRDLESLQDRVEPFPLEKARELVEGSLGRPVDEMFDRFDPPLAAASIAQVHRARLKTPMRSPVGHKPDGDEMDVAVKVIRPGVRARFARDLQTFYFAARMAERFVPAAKRLRPVIVVDSLAQTTRIELDLRMEAAAFSELAENTKDDPGILVPRVDWERSGRDCVTMDWVDGIKLSDEAGLAEAGINRETLAVTLIQTFLRHAIRDGFFHADMHPGNVFALPDGRLALIDMGIMGRIGINERRFLAEILYGFINRDYLKVAQVHFEAGYVPRHHDVDSFAQAIRAIGEPIHGQSAETVSMAKLLTLLFEVTELFDMQTRQELILLQKTMVVVEGVARILDPRFNMWKASEPVVGDWIARNLGPIGEVRQAGDALRTFYGLAKRLPEFAERAETLAADLEILAREGAHSQQRGLGAPALGALWVAALALAAIAASLLT
ncbi:MAG: 2-polyprenylphenol 6-hydroxylase [Pseudomonadota bacterium]